jgi:hypothetical protein
VHRQVISSSALLYCVYSIYIYLSISLFLCKKNGYL